MFDNFVKLAQSPPFKEVHLLPDFTSEGLLPTGDYPLTLDQLSTSLLVVGPGLSAPSWDAAWRRVLVDNLSVMVRQLWQVGIDEIFIDGSFVEDKDHPNDIDGYFHCDEARLLSGDLELDLNPLDPYKVWTWFSSSRQSVPGFSRRQLPMWIKYRVELFPHFGQPTGIVDGHGNELEFPAAFRQSRRGFAQKGIVKIIK
jgi:hypothetical protein